MSEWRKVDSREFQGYIVDNPKLHSHGWNDKQIFSYPINGVLESVAKIDFGLYEGGSVKYYLKEGGSDQP